MPPLRALALLLGHCPVKVRTGIARGAWWSFFPHSAYWRLGGNDAEVNAAISAHGTQPGSVSWDIGSHYGIYAVGMARCIGPSGSVVAFEPDPVSAARLHWHRRLNRLKNLHIHEVAASAQTRSDQLYQYDEFGAPTSHLPYLNETLQGVPARTIQLVRLDEWVAAGRLTPPHFIKIDVEGHAGPALAGMVDTLTAARPKLLVAIHSPEEHLAVREFFTALHYHCQALSAASGKRLAEENYGEMLCRPV